MQYEQAARYLCIDLTKEVNRDFIGFLVWSSRSFEV